MLGTFSYVQQNAKGEKLLCSEKETSNHSFELATMTPGESVFLSFSGLDREAAQRLLTNT
jgi:hypothetical protein